MKTTKFPIILLILTCSHQPVRAQMINWNSLENSKHIINAGFGWEHGLLYTMGYGYVVNKQTPLVLTTNFSKSSGEDFTDDFKIRTGVQVLLLNKIRMKGSITASGIYRRFENPLVRLQNLGTEITGTFGYYKPQWFVAGEVSYDKALITQVKHSQLFKETVFNDAQDGWYGPATGGNVLYGLLTGYSFKKSDITMRIGKVVVEDLQTNPLIPYYLMFGYNFKLP